MWSLYASSFLQGDFLRVEPLDRHASKGYKRLTSNVLFTLFGFRMMIVVAYLFVLLEEGEFPGNLFSDLETSRRRSLNFSSTIS